MSEYTDNKENGKALIACIISLILPGIGLLLSKNHKAKGIVIFIVAIILDLIFMFLGGIGLLCIIGVIAWLGIPVIHLLAAIYTYDTIVKENGGKPIIFD